jgi:hypothetical protein
VIVNVAAGAKFKIISLDIWQQEWKVVRIIPQWSNGRSCQWQVANHRPRLRSCLSVIFSGSGLIFDAFKYLAKKTQRPETRSSTSYRGPKWVNMIRIRQHSMKTTLFFSYDLCWPSVGDSGSSAMELWQLRNLPESRAGVGSRRRRWGWPEVGILNKSRTLLLFGWVDWS